MKTIIRIKRRADEEPAENILVKPKRPRFSEPGSGVSFLSSVEPTILERVATVESLEEELELDVLKSPKIYKKVKELQKHYKKPHTLKQTKAIARHEAKERKSSKKYKVHASHQGNLDDIELGKEGGARSKEDVDKELHVKGNKKVVQKSKSDDKSDGSPRESPSSEIHYLDVESVQQMDDVIFCNGEPLQSEKYVYDIYYISDDVNWAEYACDIQKYMYNTDDEMSYFDFDDEDDENDENNWRNDYPDEDDDDSSVEDEEDYLQRGLCKSSTRYHLDDSSDESLYEEETFDVDGNLIYYEKNPVLRLAHYVGDIKLERDSDDD